MSETLSELIRWTMKRGKEQLEIKAPNRLRVNDFLRGSGRASTVAVGAIELYVELSDPCRCRAYSFNISNS